MNNPNITDCTLINLPRIGDRNGQITSLNNLVDIPFEIRRIFYLYDIPGGESRGAHAHKQCHQLLIAASGSFEVVVEDGINKKQINLIGQILAFIYLLEFGRQKLIFRVVRFVWYWLLMYLMNLTILGII